MLNNGSRVSQRGNERSNGKLEGGKERNGKDARNSKNPCSWDACEPGTAAQIAATSVVGPPISVVPVSMAAKAVVPVVIATDVPPTETADGKQRKVVSIITINKNTANSNSPDKDNNQNEGVETGISINSISPVNSDELVPPRVNSPPTTSVWLVSVDRESQKLISGEES